MTQQQPRSEKAATPNIISLQFAEMETRVEAMIDMQTEIFAALAQISRDWFDAAGVLRRRTVPDSVLAAPRDTD
jgi:hypothetical protein